jgi:hypothetical protein
MACLLANYHTIVEVSVVIVEWATKDVDIG